MKKTARTEGLVKRIPLHPFLFAAYPVLALFAWNIKEVSLPVIWRPILIAQILAFLVFILSALFFRSWSKSAIFTTLTLILFFSYGHVYQYVVPNIGGSWGHHRVLAPIFLAVWLAGLFLVVRSKWELSNSTMILNVAMLFLLISPLYTIIRTEWIRRSRLDAMASPSQSSTSAIEIKEDIQPQVIENQGSLPDIYYIIVDSYVRSDSLKDDFGIDNSMFLDELRTMGFYIADCSRSNYTQTRLSLTSSLNMDYLQTISDSFNPENLDKTSVDPYLQKNLVMETLKSSGYSLVAIESGMPFTEFDQADVYFETPKKSIWERSIQPFESMLLNSTAMKMLNAAPMPAAREFLERISFPFYDYVEEQRFILGHMDEAAKVPGPKFVFVHIFPPHQPFLFQPDGSFTTDPRFYSASFDFPVDEEHYLLGYRNGVEFINQRLPGILRTIIDESEEQPVIILQADHGQRGRNRMMILNAFLFPDQSYEELYPSITPVNTFRVVFNNYLGKDYPLLEDVSWNSTYSEPFVFQEFGEPSEACR